MIPEDADYVSKLLDRGMLKGPVLELGTGYEGTTCRELVQARNMAYYGTDMVEGPNVDFVANFEDPIPEVVSKAPCAFGTVICMNVLEHTFDPFKVLDTIFELLGDRGRVVLCTPVLWPLHSYPKDFWRINPDFYVEYSKRRGHKLLEETFEYLGYHSVYQNKSPDCFNLPEPFRDQIQRWKGRIVHRALNTYARAMRFPSFVSIGVVIEK